MESTCHLVADWSLRELFSEEWTHYPLGNHLETLLLRWKSESLESPELDAQWQTPLCHWGFLLAT